MHVTEKMEDLHVIRQNDLIYTNTLYLDLPQEG